MRSLNATKRVWSPFAIAALCLVASTWTGPVLTWVVVLAALGLILDGATLLWSRGGGATENRQ